MTAQNRQKEQNEKEHFKNGVKQTNRTEQERTL